jgi:hypothetical protein
MERNPYAPPSSVTEVTPQIAPGEGPAGLSGWLVLVGLGLVVTPFRLAIFLGTTFPPMFKDGTWETLTTPGPAPYHPLWGPLLIGEIVVNLIFVLTSIYLVYLFFRKSWRFPRLYIAFLAANLVFLLADALAVKVVLPGQPFMDPDTAREFFRSIFAMAVWVPYLIVSKRVKNTFIRVDV